VVFCFWAGFFLEGIDMAENKNKVIVYRDWIGTFDNLTDEEAGKLIKHFFRYVNDLNPESPDRLTTLLFEPIKQTLKRDLRKYEAICLRNKDNGTKGGRPKNNPKKPSGLLRNPNKPDSDNDSDNDIIRNYVSPAFAVAFERWLKYKKERKQAYKTEDSKRAAYDKLTKISNNNPAMAEKIVEQSLANNWAGLFELKEQPKQSEIIPTYKAPPSR
jgi:hypothetical protein